MTSRILFFISLILLFAFISCKSGEEKEETTLIPVENEGIITQSSEEVSEHSSFEQLTGLFETLMNQDIGEGLGLVPLAKETIKDLSAFFPSKLMSYHQTMEAPVSRADDNIHVFTTAYEKEEEAVMFTIYQFESSLKILEFFMVIDSIYKTNPDLIVREIIIDGFEGWEVSDKEGKKHEVCLVLPDTRLIQGSAGKVFHGDINAMLVELQLTNL